MANWRNLHNLRNGMRMLFVLTLLLGLSATWAAEYFESYGLAPASATIDFGVQPLSYPAGVVSSLMRRDKILHKALAEMQQPLRTHAFYRGADMLALLADHRLQGGIFGDVPTINAAASGSVWIVGLVEQVSTGIITKGHKTVEDLVGQRIGYVDGSTAHHTLLQGLASAGIDESQVKLVGMRVDAMPDALERGSIDAFAGWDPATTIALRQSRENRVVFRGLSMDYFVLERSFVQHTPEAARQVVASLVRSIAWMRRSRQNIAQAVRWAMADAATFSGKPETLSVDEIITITRRSLLDIPSAPAIVIDPGNPPLKHQFEFLARLGKLPTTAQWATIQTSFAYDGLASVVAAPRAYRLAEFNFAD